MKKTFYLFALIIAATTSLVFDGCKKKDDDPPTKTELLTNKNWKVTALTSDPAVSINGVLVTNVFNQFNGCQKDDLFRFSTNGIYTFDEGGTKCNTNDPQTITGTWAFNANQTIVSVTQGGNTTSYNLESLNETTMKANTVFFDGANNYTWSYTYTKQ